MWLRKIPGIGWAQWLMPVISALWEAETVDQSQEFKTSLTNMEKLTKIHKISWVWWLMPIIPALWAADTGGSPEPGKVKTAVSSDHVIALQPGQQSK